MGRLNIYIHYEKYHFMIYDKFLQEITPADVFDEVNLCTEKLGNLKSQLEAEKKYSDMDLGLKHLEASSIQLSTLMHVFLK